MRQIRNKNKRTLILVCLFIGIAFVSVIMAKSRQADNNSNTKTVSKISTEQNVQESRMLGVPYAKEEFTTKAGKERTIAYINEVTAQFHDSSDAIIKNLQE